MILRLAIILMFIASIAAGGLALLNNRTAPVIAENKRIEQEQARKEVVATLADSIRFEEINVPVSDDPPDTFTYWRALGENGDLLGYAGIAYGKGYSSTIETVSGFDADFDIVGLKVTFQQETPGLGTKIVEEAFLGLFDKVSALTVAVVQDRGNIDSVTGATISSRALANSVRELAHMIQDYEQNAPSQANEDATALETSGEDILDDDADGEREYHDEEAGLNEYNDEEAE